MQTVQIPNKKDLEKLQNVRSDFCVTLYNASSNQAGYSNVGRIQFKNNLKQANKELLQAGAPLSTVAETLGPLFKLLSSPRFCNTGQTSVIVFAHSSDTYQMYIVPDSSLPNLVHVGDAFYVEPLQKIVDSNKAYFLLSLNHDHVQLFRGDRYHLQERTLHKFPTDLKTALNIDEWPRTLETHTVGPASRDNNSEAFHGQYNKSEVNKKLLKKFFRKVNRHMHTHLNGSRDPLLIGGVSYLLPIYRQVNTYPHILDTELIGNLKRTPQQNLLTQAWSAVGC